MWRVSFFLLSFLLCFSLAAQQDRWYLITETELRTIETQRQTWETNRLDWLSQVSELKVKVQNLQTTSQTLNEQLAKSLDRSKVLTQESVSLNKALQAERETAAALKRSFNLFEQEKLTQLSSMTSENSTLKSSVQDLEGKVSFWRLLAIGLLGAIILVVVLVVLRKLGILKI